MKVFSDSELAEYQQRLNEVLSNFDDDNYLKICKDFYILRSMGQFYMTSIGTILIFRLSLETVESILNDLGDYNG